MSYQPYLISNYATGFDRERQPWLLPNDAQDELLDGFVYRGVWSKRPGYSQFAIGQKGSAPYCESRMVKRVSNAAMTGAIDSTNRTYTLTATTPVRRGTFTATGNTPSQSLTDNGLGNFLYTTVNISAVALTNPCAITTAAPHGYTTGDQVFISNVGGTTELNVLTVFTITVTGVSTFTLDGINATTYTTYTSGGTVQKVAGTINYTTGAVSVTFATAPTAGTVLATYDYHPGLPVMMVANFYTATNVRQLVVADTDYVNRFNSATNRLDDISPASAYTGTNSNFFSWTNYPTSAGSPRLLFSNNVDVVQSYDGSTITAYAYTSAEFTSLICLHLFQFKDRLVLLRTTEDGTVYPRRIRISGFGTNADVFDDTAPGAGVIDIPDASWIYAAAFNRDDLIIFTENSTWILKFTGNDTVPFTLDKLDESRGSGAPYSGITYLNRTTTASPRGFIMSDGYQVQRYDDKIPYFSFDEIDQDNFNLCFAGSVDEDRDHYLIYPTPGQTQSDQILITNYEEDNFSVYRLPLSCMGNFIEAFDTTWSDLSNFNNWDEMAARYGSWNAFAYMKGLPFAVGGGHNGQIWRLNVNGIEDNGCKIRAMSVIDTNTLQIETDYNNFVAGDYIFLEGISGMVEANNKQGAIKSIITANRVFQIDIRTINFSTYTYGGQASRVIPFESITKKFNPFAQDSKKVRCGYMYFYISASTVGTMRNIPITAITQVTEAQVTAPNHQLSTGDIVVIQGVVGMLQINGKNSSITVVDDNIFTLDAIDSSSYAAYSSGGVAMADDKCFLDVDVYVNDILERTQLEDYALATITNPYRVNCTPDDRDDGSKRWYKIYINQTGRFVQFRLRNTQALSKIEIQAMMPGFAGVGRLI